MEEVKISTCLWCATGFCGIKVHTEDGNITEVEGYKDHPVSQGFTCKKGRTEVFKQYHEHPSRLNYPLKRIGERGENKWEQITWEQALDEIAEKLKSIKKKYGAESLALATGTAYTDQYWAPARFLNLFGSPNHILPGEICYCDSIVVETLRGKAKFRALVTPDILPGVVQAEHDWWFPERRGEEPELFGMWESNINVCTSDEPEHCDKLIGSWYYRAMLCKVYKA